MTFDGIVVGAAAVSEPSMPIAKPRQPRPNCTRQKARRCENARLDGSCQPRTLAGSAWRARFAVFGQSCASPVSEDRRGVAALFVVRGGELTLGIAGGTQLHI